MALVKMGALAQDVRGSLAGTVFSRNRGGAYVRQKVSPCQPMSSFSSTARSVFGAQSAAWSAVLDDGQRVAWAAFAALHPWTNVFGDAIILPAVAFFQAVNARLSMAGQVTLEDVPADWSVADMGGLAVVATTTGTVFSLTVTPERALVADEKVLVYASAPLGPARALQAGDLGFLNLAVRSGFASPAPCSAAYALRFPNRIPQVGDRVGVRAAIIQKTTGAICAPAGGVYTVTAP